MGAALAIAAAVVSAAISALALITARRVAATAKRHLAEAEHANTLARQHLVEVERSNRFVVAVDLLREYRSVEMVNARGVLHRELKHRNINLGIGGLPKDVRQAAVRVSHFLDMLGTLVERHLVDPHLVSGAIGDSVVAQWNLLAPFVRSERDDRGTAYMEYFEDLAERFRGSRPADLRTNLQSWGGAWLREDERRPRVQQP